VPGKRPYRERSPRLSDDFIDVSDRCVQCGVCAEVCPVGAIDPDNNMAHDIAKCIYCCACIKVCPEQALTMLPGMLKDASKRLAANCRERKEPEFYFA
jgi:ferredoxin